MTATRRVLYLFQERLSSHTCEAFPPWGPQVGDIFFAGSCFLTVWTICLPSRSISNFFRTRTPGVFLDFGLGNLTLNAIFDSNFLTFYFFQSCLISYFKCQVSLSWSCLSGRNKTCRFHFSPSSQISTDIFSFECSSTKGGKAQQMPVVELSPSDCISLYHVQVRVSYRFLRKWQVSNWEARWRIVHDSIGRYSLDDTDLLNSHSTKQIFVREFHSLQLSSHAYDVEVGSLSNALPPPSVVEANVGKAWRRFVIFDQFNDEYTEASR